MKKLTLAIISLIVVGCGSGNQKAKVEQQVSTELKYAQVFNIEQEDSCKVVTVKNPWVEGQELGRYVLVHRDSILPYKLPEGTLVRVPVERVAVYGALDAGMIELLGETQSVVGVCEPHYIQLQYITDNVANGNIVDLGMASNPNPEKTLLSKPDLIFSTPYQGVENTSIKRLGIPMAECANYMENVPLGRSEWLKFIAAFYCKEQLADSLFNDIESRYNSVVDATRQPESKRSILTDKRYGQSWWVPGGNSYAARLYSDASAHYFWSDTESAGSMGLSFEEVFIKASKADIWLIRYYKDDGDMTLSDLKNEYISYEHFDAFKNGNVYGCNTAVSDYYTYGIINPDRELRDIAVLLYPERFDDKSTYYFKKMK